MSVERIEPAGWRRGSGYAHGATATGRLICTAGQIGWDPVTQQLVDGGFAAQVEQALANVAAVLAAGGATGADVVRMTWYITDADAYREARAAVGASWRRHIGAHYPAMAVLVVAGLIDPGALVEIEATAVVSA